MAPEALDSLSRQELVALALALLDQVAVLTARVAELEARLGAPPKTPDNSSLPPSKGEKANRPGRAGKRRRGGRPGVTRRLCDSPDEVRDLFVAACAGCGQTLAPADQPGFHAYDHIDLPPLEPVTTRVQLHRGGCPRCGARVAARPPADMPAGSPFGPGIVALVAYLHTRHMVSYERLVEVLKDVFGLGLSEGAIANMLARAGRPFAAEAALIEAAVRGAPVIASDETSARVAGQGCWQWVFGSAAAVSHRIAASRGRAVIVDFLHGAEPQVWVSDRYAAQMGHAKAHQVCLAHLLRDAQYAIALRQAQDEGRRHDVRAGAQALAQAGAGHRPTARPPGRPDADRLSPRP